MELKMEQSILQKLSRGRRRRFWSKLVSVMMCVVMFCTTYALILPAITMEANVFCGLEPHTHTAACYPAPGELICGLSDGGEHVHTEECVSVKNMLCGLEETAGHTHDDLCGMTEETLLTCTLQETEPHTHGEGCSEEGVNICGLEETEGHIHGEECYTVTVAYSCGTEESEGHTHTDDCYEITYGCVPAEAHVHTAECYVSALTCTEEESDTHTHSEECYSVPPVCGMPAHEHGLQCLSDPNADRETAAVWEASLPGSFTGVYAEDLLAVAASQLGYTESSKNYTVDESGVVRG
ncbi:MAG: hypothetical protein IJD13_07330, partial [Oscillospiraceae bacterium]|nr:hypothetical protein [Oscillospiraceae bacterium]